MRVVAQKAAQETLQATTNAWKPLIQQVRQDVKEKSNKFELTMHLDLPNDLSKVIMIVLLHAHMQNLISPELGFRYHAKVALATNNLPDLDESDSWGILKVIQPPAQAGIVPSAPPEPVGAPAQKPMPPHDFQNASKRKSQYLT